MSAVIHPSHAPSADEGLLDRYRGVRAASERLAAPLSAEDQMVQSMPDVSPTKWHLAHTTWFFEEFVLAPGIPGYRRFHPRFAYLFNSYYNQVGAMHPRPDRGLLSRPPGTEIAAYRKHVDAHMERLLADGPADETLCQRILLGTHHEQQHQELLLTDIKHVLSCNPLKPAYGDFPGDVSDEPGPPGWVQGVSGLAETGHPGEGFCFDNETPRHRCYLEPHRLADRLVTNAEFLAFIRDGGYRRPELWLSDGWQTVQRDGWNRPLYWTQDCEAEFALGGMRSLDPASPVCHVSYYEADAYARWAGARLPREAEWEQLAAPLPVDGNLRERNLLHPRAASAGERPAQVYGDVWEWTSSPYTEYPGYRPPPGAVGEYNGKFMCNQMVLRGGSCVTPRDHVRASYRNFFYPDARWQFTGIRLARDGG